MNRLLNKNNRVIFLLVCVFVLNAYLVWVLPLHKQGGTLLFSITILVGIIGVTTGIITALALTLFVFFTLGSVYFWFSVTGESLSNMGISYFTILIWMVMLILFSLLTGRVSMLLKELQQSNKKLRQQVLTLVAVDPLTGFDNKERMLQELELEFNRAKRYEQTFAFLLMKVNYLEQFHKIYGEGEMIKLMTHLSTMLLKYTRVSDHKYRPEEDLFAVLLTNTPAEDIHIVIEKLQKELETYQLTNKKYITLPIEYGHIGFNSELNDYTEIYELAKEQVVAHVS